MVTQLTEMVDRLIKEDREMKRAMARADKAQTGGAGLGQAAKTLLGLQRRVSQALSGDAGGDGGAALTAPRRRFDAEPHGEWPLVDGAPTRTASRRRPASTSRSVA